MFTWKDPDVTFFLTFFHFFFIFWIWKRRQQHWKKLEQYILFSLLGVVAGCFHATKPNENSQRTLEATTPWEVRCGRYPLNIMVYPYHERECEFNHLCFYIYTTCFYFIKFLMLVDSYIPDSATTHPILVLLLISLLSLRVGKTGSVVKPYPQYNYSLTFRFFDFYFDFFDLFFDFLTFSVIYPSALASCNQWMV